MQDAVLFTFDGEEMTFVSDVLGVGGIGFLLEPGTYNTSRPWERFPVPQGVLAPPHARDSRAVPKPHLRRCCVVK